MSLNLMSNNVTGSSPAPSMEQEKFAELERQRANLTKCLKTNQRYQHALNWNIFQIQNMLVFNQTEQKKLNKESRKMPSRNGFITKVNKKPINLFAHPYFRDIKRRFAPDNEDTITQRARNDITAYFDSSKPWSEKEHASLSKAIYDTALKQQLKPLMNSKIFLLEKLKRDKFSDEVEEEMQRKIESKNKQMEELRKKPKLMLLNEMEGELDWLTISAVNLNGLRSPEECEKKWINLLHPGINRKRFTRSEDSNLKYFANKFHERNWDLIARRLKTNRTSIQCMERYTTKLKKGLFNKYWTPEEDGQLQATIQACRAGDKIPWHRVVYHMNGRSRVQVMNRWNRSIKPQAQFNEWRIEEDAVLYGAQKKFDGDWVKIAEFMNLRTNYTSRERYINVLAPNLKTGEWTLEEDRLLIKLVAQQGEGRWTFISKEFEDRTSQGCSQRICCMKNNNMSAYRTALSKASKGFALEEILKKQFVRSKPCPLLNQRRHEHRMKVIELFENTLKVVSPAPKRPGKEHLFTEKELRAVSKELLGEQVIPEGTFAFPTYRKLENHQRYRTSDEEEDFDDLSSSDFEIESENHDDIDHDVEELFSYRAITGVMKTPKKCLSKTHKKVLEYDVVRRIISNAFNTEMSSPPTRTVYQGVDYNDSVETVMDMFVLSPHDSSMPPVMPPNICTFNGLLNLLALQRLLDETANGTISRQALSDFKFTCLDDRRAVNSCHWCRASAKVKASSSGSCLCATLIELRKRVLTFRKRFVSVFLWVALLSTISVSQEQLERLIVKDTFYKKLLKCKGKAKMRNAKSSSKVPVVII